MDSRQNVFIIAAIALLASVWSPRANALIEARVGYEQLSSSPSAVNDSISTTNFPKVGTQAGISADLMASLPLLPFGFGLRYENLTQSSGDGSSSTGGFKSTLTRTSVILNSRFIDTLLYIGPLATVGLSNQYTFDATVSNASASYSATSSLTASIGVEGGVHLGFFILGAEIGYLYAPLGNLKKANGNDATTTSGSTVAVDFSGAYGRALLGFGF